MKRQKGFTLIELLVVITIIGILAVVGLTSYRVANQKARDSRRQADIQAIRSALEAYMGENGVYPDTLDEANDFFSERSQPTDPQTDVNYDYSCEDVSCSSYVLYFSPEIGEGTTYYNP